MCDFCKYLYAIVYIYTVFYICILYMMYFALFIVYIGLVVLMLFWYLCLSSKLHDFCTTIFNKTICFNLRPWWLNALRYQWEQIVPSTSTYQEQIVSRETQAAIEETATSSNFQFLGEHNA